MKKIGAVIIILVSLLSLQNCSNSSDPTAWSEEKINKWFESGEFLNGWKVTPDASINKREFAISYFKNKERWDKAFSFLRTTDLKSLEVKRHDIDGDNLFALVSEYMTKNEEDAKFESHKKYIDIQYVITGSEQMSISPATKKGEVLTPYDETKDLEFMTVSESKNYTATPERFFLFFPSDLHRPSVKIGENAQVKKIVVKVKL
jgi:YhcH/YjgK/YiaL family protein